MSYNPTRDEVTELVSAYCRKWRQAGNRTIARMIKLDYADHPLVKALDIEQLRKRVRIRRGANGVLIRRKVRHVIARDDRDPTKNPLALPDAYADEYEPYALPDGKALLMSDIHLHYHDVPSITRAIEYAIEHGYTDTVILNGDVLDYYHLSDFSHDPTKAHFVKERDAWFWFADALRDSFPKAKIIYKKGNHDSRFERYMWTHAQEIYGLEETSFQSVMRMKDWQVDVVGESSPMRYGQLDIFHGHEWGGGANAPVNAARTAFLKTGVCTMLGHYHQSSVHPFKTARDEFIRCWSVGCLCDLHPRYRPVNSWGRGFALLNLCDDWSVDNKAIYKGRVL